MVDELLHLTAHETVRVVRQTDDELVVEGRWNPGGSPPPPHMHPSQEERFEVRSGELTAVVDGAERRLGAGEKLQVPPGTPHKMWNAGTEPATALWQVRPAGRSAEWFRTVDRLGARGTRKPAFLQMAKAVTDYGDVFQLAVGPRPLRPLVRVALRGAALAAR